MKTQTNKKQALISITIAAIILFGASVLTFAQGKVQNDKFAFSATNQNPWLNDSTGKFDMTKLLINDFSTAKLHSMFDLPKPDFSAMFPWFEVVKYEYGDPAADLKLYIWVKVKKKPFPIPNGFQMDFRDKDGVTVDGFTKPIRDIYALTEVGDVVKTYCDLPPSETKLEEIVTARVIRVKS